MYGITWATPSHSIAQTGYVFESMRRAVRVARRGPRYAEAKGYQVDGMCKHFPMAETPIYGMIETEDRHVKEVRARA